MTSPETRLSALTRLVEEKRALLYPETPPLPTAAAQAWKPGVFDEVPTSDPEKPRRRYRRDWKAYDAALKARGNILIYLPQAVLDAWDQVGPAHHGGVKKYSDVAILATLSLGAAYNLPQRQCVGFVRSVLDALGRADLPVPDASYLSHRRKVLPVSLRVELEAFTSAALHRTGEKEITSVVLDSTGRAVKGMHSGREDKWGGEGGNRRQYRKLHSLSSPVTGEITVVEVTTSDVHDSTPVKDLLDQHKDITGSDPEELIGDGAYEGGPTVAEMESRGGVVTAPPPENAVLSPGTPEGKKLKRNQVPTRSRRDKRVLSRQKTGDDTSWKETEKYGRRSLSETLNWRYQAAFGDRLATKEVVSQNVEAKIQARLLNLWRGIEINLAGGSLSLHTA